MANYITAHSLLEEMKTAFGAANASGAEARIVQLQNAIIAGCEFVWCGHPWRWNLIPNNLVTVTSTEYTLLPADYGGQHKMGEYLYDTSTKTDKCYWVPPSLFDSKRAYYLSNDRPAWFTIRNRLISTVSTPVAEWAPTPGSAYTWGGWAYFREAPTLTFEATGSTTRVFPYAKFDILWKMAAYGFAIKHGLQLSEANEKLVGLGDFKDMMNEARAQWGVEDVQGLHSRLTDVQGDFANFIEGGDQEDDEWWLYKP